MTVVEIYERMKIYYSSFLEEYIVLYPTVNGKSSLNRFPSLEEARNFIDNNRPPYWWEKKY